jgi:uncharacterized protein YecE (DUF72 family)
VTQGRTRIGTSGWSYGHWNGVFYPEHTPPSERLAYLASRFDTVEIDSTFYHLPSTKSVAAWSDTTPDGFVFAVKGSRLITHFRRLTNIGDALATFLERLAPLGEKLGVILWQLPPNFSADNERLDAFLGELPTEMRHAVEFRHRSWLTEESYAVLRAHGAALVQVSSDAMPLELTPTADFVYVRFHGTSAYHGAYERPALEPWARFLAEQTAAGRDAYAYFNNDAEGHSPQDAARLAEMLMNSDSDREERHVHADSVVE